MKSSNYYVILRPLSHRRSRPAHLVDDRPCFPASGSPRSQYVGDVACLLPCLSLLTRYRLPNDESTFLTVIIVVIVIIVIAKLGEMRVGLGRHPKCREGANSRNDDMALSRRTGGSTEPALDTQDRQLGGCLLHGLGQTAVGGWKTRWPVSPRDRWTFLFSLCRQSSMCIAHTVRIHGNGGREVGRR